MELVERYLNAVKRLLPKAQQDDIVAELSDDISTKIEARESELGRALTLQEQADVLKPYGRPIVAAARYRPHQYLIGPGVFPYYLATLRTGLPILLALEFGGALLETLTNASIFPAGFIFNSVVWFVGVVTLFFAIRERAVARSTPGRWNPMTLPPLGTEAISRTSITIDLIFNLVFLGVILDVPGIRATLWTLMTAASKASLPLSVAGAWQPLLAALAIVSVVIVVQDCILLVRPYWTRFRSATLACTSLATGVIFSLALQSHALTIVASTPAMRDAAAALNSAVWISLLLGALIAYACAVYYAIAAFRRSGAAARSAVSG